jgi:heptosyltransferase I
VSAGPASTPPESILVVRLGAMGDIIHTLTAVSSLRSAFRNMSIGWVVEDRWSELLCTRAAPRSGPRTPQRPVADFVHVVDTKLWRRSLLSSETRRQIKAAMRQVRDQKYEVATDFQGALKSAFIARSAGAKTVVGFDQPRESPARFLYNQRIAAPGAHVIEQYHSLAEAIAGTPLPPSEPFFPRDEESGNTIAAKIAGAEKNIVLINPGAGWGAKQWPAERYGEVARALASNGLTPVINFGPGEQPLAMEVKAASRGIAHTVSCSISELIALTRRAGLFIGGDTGPLHLAAALQIPVVGIFGPTDPARNGPYGTKSLVLRDPASRTSLSHTSTPHPALLNITADEVISAVRKLLENSGA